MRYAYNHRQYSHLELSLKLSYVSLGLKHTITPKSFTQMSNGVRDTQNRADFSFIPFITKCFANYFSVFFIIQIMKSDRISSDGNSASAPPKAIQIVISENHAFRLNLNELLPIFEDDNLKNRQIVVASIVGPYRFGKSFLMNFFIRFLDAQVNTNKFS